MSQPPTTPVQPDEAPSNQSKPSQNPIEEEQQPIHTAGSTSPSAVFVSLSSENEAQAAEQVTQYIPQPYRNPLSQSNPESDPVPPSDTNSTPQNNQTNTDEQVEGIPKVSKRRSAKRPLPTGQSFIPNPDPDKPPSIYVPVESEEFSDENAGYHCYESEELRSIASDEDADQPPVFPQSNVDAPVSQVQLELGIEFETLSHFRKAVRKFNINLGRSIFFSRCDSTRSKAICYDEECPWQIYCAKRSFPLSYQVKTFVNEHTCSRDNHCKSANEKWVVNELEERIRVQPNLTVREADQFFRNEYDVLINERKIYRAMGKAKERIEGSEIAQYARLLPSQEFWEKLDTLPILPPRYKKPIGRPSLKRDKRNDGPAEIPDPHRTKRKYGTIVCKYCLQEHVNAGDEDPDVLAEMYWEETLKAADAEAAAAGTNEGSGLAVPQAAVETQPNLPPNPTIIKNPAKRRSVKRPPPTVPPSTRPPSTNPLTTNSETTPMVTPQTMKGASAGTTTRFMQFMPTPGATVRGRGTTVRGRGTSSEPSNVVSSGSSNSTPKS
ncbi:hypothetical protein Ahy_A03g014269 [Arachis hypogaea]|uniref:Transposase MuDR plant domain-containing protein n=1 Tax=Arachis hypogaea TaxID=3818 RepID=A0A445DXA5_ARAHY|nr:hypothetical protein Ahy_A03g014269 [Arachis hypogaea]